MEEGVLFVLRRSFWAPTGGLLALSPDVSSLREACAKWEGWGPCCLALVAGIRCADYRSVQRGEEGSAHTSHNWSEAYPDRGVCMCVYSVTHGHTRVTCTEPGPPF